MGKKTLPPAQRRGLLLEKTITLAQRRGLFTQKTIPLARRRGLFCQKTIPLAWRRGLFCQKTVPRAWRRGLFLPEFDFGNRQIVRRRPRRVFGTGRLGLGVNEFGRLDREIVWPGYRSDLAGGGTLLLSSPRTQPPPLSSDRRN